MNKHRRRFAKARRKAVKARRESRRALCAGLGALDDMLIAIGWNMPNDDDDMDEDEDEEP